MPHASMEPHAAERRSESAFDGRMPAAPGDWRPEARGIAPVPENHRYGGAGRLFTVWFAPNLTMSGVFTGTVGIALGLDFATALAAVVLGTVLGAVPTAYLGTWGSRTGAGQLPLARLAFGRGVVVPGTLQWLSSIAWDALIGLFGGDALARLCGWPFWLGALVMMTAQGALGALGYEAIHRLQKWMTAVLAVAFCALALRLAHAGVTPVSHGGAHGADRVGAFALTTTIALSLAVSWAPYASDFSRYLPRATSASRMFWCTLAGVVVSFTAVQALGLWGASVFTDQTAHGVDTLLGGGVLGSAGLLAVALAALCSNAMNDYSGSLALQVIGARVPRPLAAGLAALLGFPLVLWMHAADTAARFQNVLLFVGYWIPGFVAVVLVDWLARARARNGTPLDLAVEQSRRQPFLPALLAFLAAFAATVPFMNTSLYVGPVAEALHGADLGYYVAFVVGFGIYAPIRMRGSAAGGVARRAS
ncbi:cytosine permease [Streptomyces kunmingensis]|uniref:Cytosine permease n=2 Tax=Streptomyces kunmingensis TaxID=68225 RepID=A0ABU6CJH7_9ACTN|nr:cytosine permease [Streptomyces kunmingensis]MEB3964386.1 cytosine permease [Streptomyces kunmingensis]